MKTNYADRPIGIPTEEDHLVRQAKSGNVYAFAQLYDACVEQVYRYISFRLVNDRVAEAVTVQVFFKAWEQLDQYQVFGPPFVMWLYAIARNQVIAYYLKRKQLKLLLQTVFLLNRGREVTPSSTFTAFTRFSLIEYARSHPRQQRGVTLSWRMTTTLATLVVALLVTETVHAQSALPGDVDYGWKRTSELAWRALAPDPVAVDIVLSERRLNEWIAVANNPALNISAGDSYRDALSRLASSRDAKTFARITPMLQSQQQALKDAGLPTSELDNYLTGMLTPSVIPVTGSQPAATEVPTEIAPNDCAPNCGNNQGSVSTSDDKGNNGNNDDKGNNGNNNDKGNNGKNNDKGNNGNNDDKGNNGNNNDKGNNGNNDDKGNNGKKP